jgi:2-dehydropantoate 2-reductase
VVHHRPFLVYTLEYLVLATGPPFIFFRSTTINNMRKTQKYSIAFLGTGANGSSIAADIIHAGYEVSCYDQWPENVESVRQNGLIINSATGAKNVQAQVFHLCQLAEQPKSFFDIIFMAFKSYDTLWACELIKPYLSDGGILVGLQNGMTAGMIEKSVGKKRTIGCVVELSSEMTQPGIVQRNTPKEQTWFGIGSLNNENISAIDKIRDILSCAGTVSVSENISSAKWMKLLVNTMSLAPFALLGLPVQAGLSEVGMREIVIKIGQEAMWLGEALGFKVEPIMGLTPEEMRQANRLPEKLLDTLVGHIGPAARDCILQDFLKGRRTEIEMINGLVVEESKKIGKAAPYNAAVVEIGEMISSGIISPKPENIELLQDVIKRNLG